MSGLSGSWDAMRRLRDAEAGRPIGRARRCDGPPAAPCESPATVALGRADLGPGAEARVCAAHAVPLERKGWVRRCAPMSEPYANAARSPS